MVTANCTPLQGLCAVGFVPLERFVLSAETDAGVLQGPYTMTANGVRLT